MQSIKHHRWLAAACIVILSLTAVILVSQIHRRYDISLSNGGLVHVFPSSAWVSWFSNGNCKIVYQPRGGKSGAVTLLQDLDSGPAIVLPTTDGTNLLCLYYADVLFRLLKIDPTKTQTAFPKNSYLTYVVLSSDYYIEPATTNDWQYTYKYLNTVPNNVFNSQSFTMTDFGIFRLKYKQEFLMKETRRQLDNMERGYNNY